MSLRDEEPPFLDIDEIERHIDTALRSLEYFETELSQYENQAAHPLLLMKMAELMRKNANTLRLAYEMIFNHMKCFPQYHMERREKLMDQLEEIHLKRFSFRGN